MDNKKSILTVQDYGQIEMHLKQLMDERNINRNSLARRTNTRFEVIDKWYHGEVEKLDMDILARICYVLDCSVSDILKEKN